MGIVFGSSHVQPGSVKKNNFLEAQAKVLANSSRLYAEKLLRGHDERLRIGHAYNSPLREDSNPSFTLFFNRGDKKILWHDFATGETGDVIKFYAILWKCTYCQALENLSNGNYRMSSRIETGVGLYSRHKKEMQLLQIVPIDWTPENLAFWVKYGISRETLDKFNVTALSKWAIDGHVMYTSEFPKDPLYAWRVFSSIKVYAPYGGTSRKWRCTASSSDIQGWEQLKYGSGHDVPSVLFITKSLKDVMVLYEMGYAAIAPQSEMCNIPSVAMEEIDRRYGKGRIFVFFDNDTAGQQGAARLISHRPGWFNMVLPVIENFNAKDISDYVLVHGMDKAREWIQQRLERYSAS